MASRRHLLPVYEGRSVQAPVMVRHLPLLPGNEQMEPYPPLELLEKKLAIQVEEIDRLAGDNHKLAAAHMALRQDLIAAQNKIDKLKEHIRSIRVEGDIQIQICLDKIAKMEADIRAGESVRKDLQQAHLEARGLVTARQELSAQLQQATQELVRAHADIKKLPEMRAELDRLRQEHQRLRKTFEYEKGLNIEKVEQLQVMEKDLVGVAGEAERLRAEVLNAEKRMQAPHYYGGPYAGLYPSPMPNGGAYVDSYGRPQVQMNVGPMRPGMVPFNVACPEAAPEIVGQAVTDGCAGSYEDMYARR